MPFYLKRTFLMLWWNTFIFPLDVIFFGYYIRSACSVQDNTFSSNLFDWLIPSPTEICSFLIEVWCHLPTKRVRTHMGLLLTFVFCLHVSTPKLHFKSGHFVAFLHIMLARFPVIRLPLSEILLLYYRSLCFHRNVRMWLLKLIQTSCGNFIGMSWEYGFHRHLELSSL